MRDNQSEIEQIILELMEKEKMTAKEIYAKGFNISFEFFMIAMKSLIKEGFVSVDFYEPQIFYTRTFKGYERCNWYYM